MSAAAAVFRRELIEKKKSVLFCLILGLYPVFAPLINSLLNGNRASNAGSRELLVTVVSATLFVTVAFLGGVTTIGRDLVENRLSFYFSRPISVGTLWVGKIAASVMIAFACGVAAAIPTFLVAGPPGLVGGTKGFVLLGAVVAIPLVALIGHAMGISVRSKSAWLVLDVLALGGVAFFVWSYIRLLLVSVASKLGIVLLVALAVVLFVSLAAAGYAQLAFGRTEIRTGHRAMSLTLWTPVLVFVVSVAAYLAWLAKGTPSDLNAALAERVSPRGDWVEIGGPRRFGLGYQSSFLFHPADGRYVPLGMFADTRFSADGSTAVVVVQSLDAANAVSVSLLHARLDRNPVFLEPTEIVFRGYPPFIGVSGDGRRVATFDGHTMSVIDLERRRSLMSGVIATGAAWPSARFLFVGNELVRCYAVRAESGLTPASVRIIEMNLAARKIRETGSFERTSEFRVAPDGAVILMGTRLLDGATGALLRELGPGKGVNSEFTSDGRIIITRGGDRASQAELFDRSGNLLRHIDLPPAPFIRIGGEMAPGRILLRPDSGDASLGEAWILDLDRGDMRRIAIPGTSPLASGGRMWRLNGASSAVVPGSVATRLFNRNDGSLVELDPRSGEERVILAGRLAPSGRK